MFDYRLKVFLAAARLLNFNRAAEELHITQPAVTRHVKELETAAGVALFDRSRRAVALTPAGELLLRHAQNVFEQHQRFEFDLHRLKKELCGELRMGASTTVAQYVLPPFLARFHHDYPGVRIRLTNANSQEIQRLLLDRSIDLGVTEGLKKSADLVFHPFLDDELALVCRAGNPRLPGRPLKLAELASFTFVSRETGSGAAEVVRTELEKRGLPEAVCDPAVRLGGSEAIKTYLAHSDAFAFLSTAAVRCEIDSGRLVAVPVSGLRLTREFHFAMRLGEPPPLAQFVMKFIRKSLRLKI